MRFFLYCFKKGEEGTLYRKEGTMSLRHRSQGSDHWVIEGDYLMAKEEVSLSDRRTPHGDEAVQTWEKMPEKKSLH